MVHTTKRSEVFPVWSPDGRWIVFNQYGDGAAHRVVKLNLVDGDRKAVDWISGAYVSNYGQPAWQPLTE